MKIKALILFVCLATVLIFYTLHCDRTSYTSNDGMFKSTWVKTWMSEGGSKLSKSSHALYYPVMAALVPFLGFSNHGYLFEKLATINSVFGAGCVAVLFLMMCQLGLKTSSALWLSVLHLGFAGVLVQVSGNDDIVPSYFFYLVGYYFLVQFFKTRKLLFIFKCGLSLAAALLLHWSVIVAAAPVFLVALIWKSDSVQSKLNNGLVFFLAITAPSAVIYQIMGFKWYEIFIPENVSYSQGWVQFTSEKLAQLPVGIAQYVIRSKFWRWEFISQVPVMKIEVFVALSFIIILIGICLYLMRNYKTNSNSKAALFTGLGVFFIAEICNWFNQPVSPQFQIQPLFLITLILAFIVHTAEIWNLKKLKAFILSILILLFIYNVTITGQENGRDSAAIQNLKTLESKFPFEKTLFLLSGFDLFVPYHEAVRSLTEYGHEENNEMDFTTSLDLFNNGTEKDPLQFWKRKISLAENRGYKIVMDKTWELDDAQFLKHYIQFNHPESVLPIFKYLKNNYEVFSTVSVTEWGNYYELRLRQELK